MKRVPIKILTLGLILLISFGSLALTKSEYLRQLEQSQKLIHWVNRELFSRYVDDIDIDAFTKHSIKSILTELDPYTVFLEHEERDGLELLTSGKYGGVGIQIGRRENRLTVIAPMDDTPAQRAGIISGDRILAIDDEPTTDMTLDDAAKRIRGEKGTVVKLTIGRHVDEHTLEFELTRADITVKDVAYTGLLDESTGYIRLTRFSKNAPYEMRRSLKELQRQQVDAIVLDMRDNPGGLLQSAIGVLDLFVEKGEVLLTTKGRSRNTDRSFKSDRNPVIDSDIKIAVLINQGSASASEIVAGALQDLDRAVILGKRSFGKGLVQSVYNFDENTSLKITTAKYYIPSGRLIQKPDYNNSDLIAWSTAEDTTFFTIGGRPVKGGGGIFPDIEVETPPASSLVRESWRNGYFFSFVQEYRDRFSSPDEIIIDDELLIAYREYIIQHDIDIPVAGESQFDEAREKLVVLDSANTDLLTALNQIESFIETHEQMEISEHLDQVRINLKMEFANLFDGTEGRIKISLDEDLVVQEALNVLSDSGKYDNIFVAK